MQTAKNTSQSVVKNCDVKMTMRKRIGSTVYEVNVTCNPDARETMSEKILRLIKNDLHFSPRPATIKMLQAGRLSGRSSA